MGCMKAAEDQGANKGQVRNAYWIGIVLALKLWRLKGGQEGRRGGE